MLTPEYELLTGELQQGDSITTNQLLAQWPQRHVTPTKIVICHGSDFWTMTRCGKLTNGSRARIHVSRIAKNLSGFINVPASMSMETLSLITTVPHRRRST